MIAGITGSILLEDNPDRNSDPDFIKQYPIHGFLVLELKLYVVQTSNSLKMFCYSLNNDIMDYLGFT